MIYYAGEGTARNEAQAERYLRLAAEEGVRSAYTPLGALYYEGVDGLPNDEAALRFLQLAEQAGDTGACSLLGMMYYEGRGVDRDLAKCVELLTRFASENHDTAVSALLGSIYYRGGKGVDRDYEEAYVHLLPAAEGRDVPSQVLLARLYYDGDGIRQDRQAALRYLTAGLEAEIPAALALRGRMYYFGDGGERDVEKGLSLLRRASELGDDEAGAFLRREEERGRDTATKQLATRVIPENAPAGEVPEDGALYLYDKIHYGMSPERLRTVVARTLGVLPFYQTYPNLIIQI